MEKEEIESYTKLDFYFLFNFESSTIFQLDFFHICLRSSLRVDLDPILAAMVLCNNNFDLHYAITFETLECVWGMRRDVLLCFYLMAK
jgi:hypothetical protein